MSGKHQRKITFPDLAKLIAALGAAIAEIIRALHR
jgi:hypothetical protein